MHHNRGIAKKGLTTMKFSNYRHFRRIYCGAEIELSEINITRPSLEKRKHSYYWQRGRVAKHTYINTYTQTHAFIHAYSTYIHACIQYIYT